MGVEGAGESQTAPVGWAASRGLALVLLAGATGLGLLAAQLSRTDQGPPVLNGPGLCAVTHGIVFALWGGAWRLCWERVCRPKGGRGLLLLVAALVAAFGEWVEILLPGHEFDLADLALNGVGALVGLSLAHLLLRRFESLSGGPLPPASADAIRSP